MSDQSIIDTIECWWEKWYPLLCGGVATLAAWNWNIQLVGGRLDSFLAVGISIASIFAGFLTTAKTMIYTNNSPFMRRIKKRQQFTNYTNYVRQAIIACFVVVLVCGLGFFLKQDLAWYHYGLLGVVTWMITACYRSSSQFFLLMKLDHKENVSRSDYYGEE